MVIVFSFCHIYELYIYCKVIFIIHIVHCNLILKISADPYLLACPRTLKTIEPALGILSLRKHWYAYDNKENLIVL